MLSGSDSTAFIQAGIAFSGSRSLKGIPYTGSFTGDEAYWSHKFLSSLHVREDIKQNITALNTVINVYA